MDDRIRRFFSHDAGPLAQFIKYGAIGVVSTLVQTGVFYILASLWLRCLTPDDWAVSLLGLPSASFSGEEAWYAARGTLAAVDTAGGFIVANVFCWLMNRRFVFRPGKFRWYVEFGMFFGVATIATVIALGVMKALIDVLGLMTTLAVVVEVLVSFFVNFFVRKFVIFRG
ncbi:MAG: GtrA family protein [Kiritimatiellia bacterium]